MERNGACCTTLLAPAEVAAAASNATMGSEGVTKACRYRWDCANMNEGVQRRAVSDTLMT